MDNPSVAVDLPTEPTSAAMHPRLHRQKLQSKTNRGKTFRSMKNNKAVANIEVRFCLPNVFFFCFFFPVSLEMFDSIFSSGVAHRSGTGIGDHQSIRQSDFVILRFDRFIRHGRPPAEHVPVAPSAEFQLRTADDDDDTVDGRNRIETGRSHSQSPGPLDPFESIGRSRRTFRSDDQHQSLSAVRRTRVRLHGQVLRRDGLCGCGRPGVDRLLCSGS
jgi:hypothetical protein